MLADLDPEDRPYQLKVGDPVRFSDRMQWVYGSIVADLGDDMFTVKLDDGAAATLDAGSLQCLNRPRDPDRSWPHQEDCTHCPGKAGPNGTHKFGCALYGARGSQVRLNAVQDPNGTFKVVDPNAN